MLIETSALWDFTIFAVDGEIGWVSDLQVDDRRWAVADIVVSVSHWPADQLVILPPARVAAVGHIEGWLVDSHGWRVSYAVVKAAAGATRKHLLLPVSPLGPISWSGRAIHADLPREAIVRAPDYQPGKPPDADYEARLRG